MDDTTSLLFGLDSFRVVDVVRVADRAVQVVVETVERQGLSPACGPGGPGGEGPLAGAGYCATCPWPISSWRCGGVSAVSCAARTDLCAPLVHADQRRRLRPGPGWSSAPATAAPTEAVARSNRAVSEVAAEELEDLLAHGAPGLGVSCAEWLPAPAPTHVLGIDKTGDRADRCGSCTTSGGGAATRG